MDAMDARQEIQRLLVQIKRTTETISFEDENAIKKVLDTDTDRIVRDLAEVQETHRNSIQKCERLKKSVGALKIKLEKIEEVKKEKLRLATKLQKEQHQFSDCTVKDQTETLNLRSLLNTYKEITGTHFNYKSKNNVVSGFVGEVGVTPEQSQLLPFTYDLSDPDITSKIWDKIKEASDCTRQSDSDGNK